jgi:hypothetical protein
MLQLVPILLLICYLVTTVTFWGNLDGRLFFAPCEDANNMEGCNIFYYLRNLEGGMRGRLNDIINIPLGGVHLFVNSGYLFGEF